MYLMLNSVTGKTGLSLWTLIRDHMQTYGCNVVEELNEKLIQKSIDNK